MGSQLNKNNPLRWTGAFDNLVFSNIAVNDAPSISLDGDGSLIIDPLANDTSDAGIDFTSLAITTQDNLTKPATWNSATQRITYYLGAGVTTGPRILKYKWADIYGNLSNEATISITVTPKATVWSTSPLDYACVLVEGVKTGYGHYSQLRQYYTNGYDSDHKSLWTLTGEVKPNVEGDPDFVADAIDDINCSPVTFLTRTLNFDEVSTVPCGDVGPGTDYYVDPHEPTWRVGMLIYTDNTLLTTADTGYYSDHTYLLQVFEGRIINVSNCGA